jgi:AcrR family transcriptional regulator
MNVRRMEDVARRAGMTTGAIYGNFKNRDELFIAMSEAYWPPSGRRQLRARGSLERCARSPKQSCCNSRTTAVVRTFGGPDQPTAAAPASPSIQETMSQQVGARGNDRD